VNSKDGIDFAMLLALRAPRYRSDGNDGGLQILRCQGFEVKYYDVTLDALTLKPSDVCNVGVKRNTGTIFVGFAYLDVSLQSEIATRLANPTRLMKTIGLTQPTI
jgi:hypothetical protein